jgi:hypothetical protein
VTILGLSPAFTPCEVHFGTLSVIACEKTLEQEPVIHQNNAKLFKIIRTMQNYSRLSEQCKTYILKINVQTSLGLVFRTKVMTPVLKPQI